MINLKTPFKPGKPLADPTSPSLSISPPVSVPSPTTHAKSPPKPTTKEEEKDSTTFLTQVMGMYENESDSEGDEGMTKCNIEDNNSWDNDWIPFDILEELRNYAPRPRNGKGPRRAINALRFALEHPVTVHRDSERKAIVPPTPQVDTPSRKMESTRKPIEDKHQEELREAEGMINTMKERLSVVEANLVSVLNNGNFSELSMNGKRLLDEIQIVQ